MKKDNNKQTKNHSNYNKKIKKEFSFLNVIKLKIIFNPFVPSAPFLYPLFREYWGALGALGALEAKGLKELL